MQDENSNKWELGMSYEIDSLLRNQTWELIELPARKNVLHNKWVYKVKTKHDDNKWFKAKLIMKKVLKKRY